MIAVTPLILTFNEQENIGRTLAALLWAPEVVLIDSFSTDATLAIAAATHPRVRVAQRRFDSFAGQCNFGLGQIRTPWVLSLDADYELEAALCSEISALEPGPEVTGYRAHFRYCVWGRALRSTLYPPRVILYRRDVAAYENDGHGHRVRVEGGAVLPLQGRVRHDDRKPLTRWLQSQDRYMRIEAPHLLATPRAALSRQDRLRRWAFLAPAVMFLYLMFVRGLVLDGWPGWYYVFQRTLAETLLALRIITEREKLESTPGRDPLAAERGQ